MIKKNLVRKATERKKDMYFIEIEGGFFFQINDLLSFRKKEISLRAKLEGIFQ